MRGENNCRALKRKAWKFIQAIPNDSANLNGNAANGSIGQVRETHRRMGRKDWEKRTDATS